MRCCLTRCAAAGDDAGVRTPWTIGVWVGSLLLLGPGCRKAALPPDAAPEPPKLLQAAEPAAEEEAVVVPKAPTDANRMPGVPEFRKASQGVYEHTKRCFAEHPATAEEAKGPSEVRIT